MDKDYLFSIAMNVICCEAIFIIMIFLILINQELIISFYICFILVVIAIMLFIITLCKISKK